MTQQSFAGYYAAKFARIKKAYPTRWIIIPTRNGVDLVYVGPTASQGPELSLV